ncbi:MAG: IS200/IS605 family transposase [Chitinophagaceae bacterium]|nr:IS200/IS605 family transposase [Chitinophagaceae bacterium]
MANTYSQISIHAVFAVKYRSSYITKSWRDELHSYISGIITNEGAKSLAVGGWLDHVHIFFGMPVTTCIADFMQTVKANSSRWINEREFISQKFQWQSGYGAFSYARSQRSNVINYIKNQEQHHSAKTFKQEYYEILQKFEVQYDEKYLFEFYE